MLIKSYPERMERSADKKRKILRFLKEETWTSSKNIGLLLGVQYLTAHRTLSQMKRDNLIKSESFQGLGGKFTLWGVTPHGLAMAYDEDELLQERAHFDRSKVAISTVNHTLDLQVAQIKAERAGWTAWLNGKFLSNRNPHKRPDAVATNPDGLTIAIEVERTIKTKKRYEQVMSTYLQAINSHHYDQVIYLSPTNIKLNLERLFRQITEVPVEGERISVSSKHHEKFQFITMDNWPNY